MTTPKFSQKESVSLRHGGNGIVVHVIVNADGVFYDVGFRDGQILTYPESDLFKEERTLVEMELQDSDTGLAEQQHRQELYEKEHKRFYL